MPHLFVGVDDSEGARRALDWAVAEADLRGEPLTLLRVLPAMTLRLGEAGLLDADRVRVEEGAVEFERKLLNALLHSVRAEQVDVTGEVLPGGAVADSLVTRTAGSSGLVVGSRGRGGFASLLLGSVGHQLLQHAQCPVVVVPDRGPGPRSAVRRVVVGVDGSPCSVQALVRAAEEARIRGARLDVVTVDDPPPPIGETATSEGAYVNALWGFAPTSAAAGHMNPDELEWRREESLAIWRAHGQAVLDRALDHLDDDDRPEIEPIVSAHRHPARHLLDIAEGAELLVLGSRGLGGFRGLLLGSVSQQCVHHATIPVMVLHTRSD